MIKALTSLFLGARKSGITKLAQKFLTDELERAKAGAIETESKALLLKCVDPNGEMRRNISANVTRLYVLYVLIMLIVVLLQAFSGVLDLQTESIKALDKAVTNLNELFTGITTLFGLIISASFGVNASNIIKNK